ncbi:MAG: hypothetical protein QOH13_1758 [Thermoleophilaceae bacterium]|jgi:hypothetical protein|nr:hypothetical protein [Thermoleophilaceae bacterium]
MKRAIAAVALAVAASVVAPVAATAQGTDPNGKARFVGPIHVSGKKATLSVSYQCASGQTVWVSAKELASGASSAKLAKEGSSKTAAAWWESHRNRFVCNGKPHTATFTIDKVEKGSKGTLVPGKAWVQFCVTKGTTEANTKLILSKSGWVAIA